MARIDYVSQTPQSVSVTYAGMPAQTEVLFVNQTTGDKTPSASTALRDGGDGAADIPIGGTLSPGQYYLLAQVMPGKDYVAQTIAFSIK